MNYIIIYIILLISQIKKPDSMNILEINRLTQRKRGEKWGGREKNEYNKRNFKLKTSYNIT